MVDAIGLMDEILHYPKSLESSELQKIWDEVVQDFLYQQYLVVATSLPCYCCPRALPLQAWA